MSRKNQPTTIGLKELRLNTDKYIKAVKTGKSFTVVRRSKPVFTISAPNTTDNWEVVLDLSQINKQGVSAKKVLEIIKGIDG